MNVESQLKDALQSAAESRQVDVHALHAHTKDRLAARVASPRRSPAIRTRPPWTRVAVAAGVVAVLGVGAVLGGLVGLGPLQPDGDANDPMGETGKVARDFTCPAQQTSLIRNDDSFLPGLTRGLEPDGEATVAPRWAVELTDDGPLLRLGNADGSLASVTTFRTSADGYEAVQVTKCSNESSDASGEAPPLVAEGLPQSAGALTAADLEPGAVKVVDRLTYDTAGLNKRHTVWAEPCGRRLCLVAGTRTDTITIDRLPTEPVPEDRSTQLADPDDVVGQDLGFRLVAVYDGEDALSGVSWVSRTTGRTTQVEPVTSDGWPGRLFLILAPDSELVLVTVHPSAGLATSYFVDDIGS